MQLRKTDVVTFWTVWEKETDHEKDSNGFPAFSNIVIAGDYISFESGYAGEYHWYVIRKDGTFVKEIPMG